jgi:hypothetical protein
MMSAVESEIRQPSTVAWPQFAASNPELAAFGATRPTASPAYLATIRPDGSPRVHPISPIVGPAGLFAFMESTSPKAADLRARAEFALHRGVPDNAGTGGEFYVSGRGFGVDDLSTRAEASVAASYSPEARYIHFELRLSEAGVGPSLADVTEVKPPSASDLGLLLDIGCRSEIEGRRRPSQVPRPT